MSYIDALILGIVQGITEFFPISSSGHLILFQKFLNTDFEQFFYFSVFVHLATLFAIVIYFRSTLWNLVKGLLTNQKSSWQLLGALIIATIPAIPIAFVLKNYIDTMFSTPIVVLVCMILTATLFLVTEYIYKKNQSIIEAKDPSLWQSLIIGIVQAIAILPGISRSGSTLSAGILLKLNREKAAEFSFLMAIPTILGACIFTLQDGLKSSITIDWGVYTVGFIASFISGYFAISFLIQLYKKASLHWFAIYLYIVAAVGIVIVL